MRTLVRTWVALAIVALMSGCAAGPAPTPAAPGAGPLFVGADDLQPGFYAFEHPGGTLRIRLAGGAAAHLELFDPDDRRLGQYGLGPAQSPAEVRLESLAAGEYVVRVASANGSLRIDGPSVPALFRPLSWHVERMVLATASEGQMPAVPFVGVDRTRAELDIHLDRTPVSLRVLAAASFGDLALRLEGAAGEVLTAHTRGPFGSIGPSGPFGPFGPFGPASDWWEVPSSFRPEGASNASLAGFIEVEDLRGTIVLESASYSRAGPPGQHRTGMAPKRPAFVYGQLPAHPVAFEVSPQAPRLHFWHDPDDPGAGDGWVALFGPDGQRVATVRVPDNDAPRPYATVAVRQAGTHVAVALAGNVTMGADASPARFLLAPLRVLSSEHPEQPAGDDGTYGQANGTVGGSGRGGGHNGTEGGSGAAGAADAVAFDVRPAVLQDPVGPFAFGCAPTSVRVLQGGEVLGAWGPQWTSPGSPAPPAGALLGDGAMTVWHDGFGASACPRTGVRILSFSIEEAGGALSTGPLPVAAATSLPPGGGPRVVAGAGGA